MSFGITIFLPEKKISQADYSAFLDDCASILGAWHIHERTPFNLNSDETVHDCVLLDSTDKYAKSKKDVSVWVSLERHNFTKTYGRSRRKLHWAIFTETKAGRSFWDYVIQMLIPLKAFAHFSEIVILVDSEKVFLHPKTYKGFVASELVKFYGEDVLEQIGFLDDEAAAPNNSRNRSAS